MTARNTEALAQKLITEAKCVGWENGAKDEADAESQAVFFLDDIDTLRKYAGFDFLAAVSRDDLRVAAARAIAVLQGR